MSNRLLPAFFVFLSLVFLAIPAYSLFEGIFEQQPNFLILDDTKDHNLNDLTDVTTSSVLNNQIIVFNSTTQQWENENQGAGGGGGRTYTGIAPIIIDNDQNTIVWQPQEETDFNGTFDGNESTFYINWQNHVNRLFSLIELDDNSSFDGRYNLTSDSNNTNRLDESVIANPPWLEQGDYNVSTLTGGTFGGTSRYIFAGTSATTIEIDPSQREIVFDGGGQAEIRTGANSIFLNLGGSSKFVSIDGDVDPSGNATFDGGSSGTRWRDWWLSRTLHSLNVDATGDSNAGQRFCLDGNCITSWDDVNGSVSGASDTNAWTEGFLESDTNAILQDVNASKKLAVDGNALFNSYVDVNGFGTGDVLSEDYDLRVGIAGAGGGGCIKIGDYEICDTGNMGSIGSLSLDNYMIFRDMDGDSNVSFMFITPGTLPRFVIPREGADFATNNFRSFILGGDLGQAQDDDIILCSANGYDKIDCDTNATGADLGVQDDAQIRGSLFVDENVSVIEDINSLRSCLSGDCIDAWLDVNHFFNVNHFTVPNNLVSILPDGIDDTLIDWGTDINQVNAADIPIALNGGDSPTVDQIQEYFDNIGSSGFYSGGNLFDAGGGAIDVAAGAGMIRATDSDNAPILSFTWSDANSISIDENTTRYIYIDYNSGSPGVVVSASEFDETPSKIIIGVATNENKIIESTFNLGVKLEESIGQAGRFIRRVNGISRDTRRGGLIVGETGTRNLTLSAGHLWWGRTDYTINALDTNSSGSFDLYFRNGVGGFTKVAAQTQWPNTQYDDGTGTLNTLTGNKWGTLWGYLEPDDHVVMVYGREEHNFEAAAELEDVPNTLPPRLQQTAILAARFIFQNGAETASIESAFDVLFTSVGVDSHTELANLAWTSANHTGTASTLAGFDGASAAIEYTESDYCLVDGSRDFTGIVTFNESIDVDKDVNGHTGNFNDVNLVDPNGVEDTANLRVTSAGVTNLQTSDGRFRITHPTDPLFLIMGDGASNNAAPFKFEPGEDHFQFVPLAGFDMWFYEDASSGETMETRIYGFPSTGTLDYASFKISGETNDLNISTNKAGSRVIIDDLNIHDDLNVKDELLVENKISTVDFVSTGDLNVKGPSNFDQNIFIDENVSVNFMNDLNQVAACFRFDGNIFILRGSGGC